MAENGPPEVGRRVQVDGQYGGQVMYKGKIKGRKGEWLGLQMDDTIGDCDGTIAGDRYFTCEDAQGLFIKWGSGRVVAAPERVVIPQPVLEHMRMLFNICDASQSGGLDVSELLQAIQLLGRRVTKKEAQQMYKQIVNDADRVSSNQTGIEFDEFRQVMEEQWLGVDLDAVVQSIQQEEAEDLQRQENARLAALEQDLAVDVMGVAVDLNYFGAGTNVGLLLVYTCLALAVTGQIYLHVPEDTLTFCMVAVLSSSAVLFGIGGVAIKAQNWPLVKLYSVLLFFVAGMQFAVCIAFKVGLFRMSTSVVAAVMDRECGTCIGAERCATISSSVLPAQNAEIRDRPWYCCCAHNECRGSELTVQAQATCDDACALADLTGSDTDSRVSCLSQGEPLESTCVYLGAADAVCNRGTSCAQDDPTHPTLPDECYTVAGVAIGEDLPPCPAMTGLESAAASAICLGFAGCEYTPGMVRTCAQNEQVNCGENAQSESACTATGVCVFTPAVYGIGDLSTEEQETKQMCQTRDDYIDFARVHAYPMASVLDDEHCFDRTDDPNEASGYAGLAGCLESYQSSMQVWYLAMQLLMLPIVLLAAYVGWVLPDIYIQKVTQAQAQGVDSFLSTLTFSNPIDEETGAKDVAKEGNANAPSEASAIADALLQAKQTKMKMEEEKELQTIGPYLSGRYKPTNAAIAKAKISAPTGARVSGTVPGSQAEKAGVRKGWLLHSINGKVVSSQRPEKVVSMLRDAGRPLSASFHQPYQRSNTGPIEIIFKEPGEIGLQFERTARVSQQEDDTVIKRVNPLATESTRHGQGAEDSQIKVSNPLMKQSADNEE